MGMSNLYSGNVRKLPRTYSNGSTIGSQGKPYSTYKHYDNRAPRANFTSTTYRYFVLNTAYNGALGSSLSFSFLHHSGHPAVTHAEIQRALGAKRFQMDGASGIYI